MIREVEKPIHNYTCALCGEEKDTGFLIRTVTVRWGEKQRYLRLICGSCYAAIKLYVYGLEEDGN